MKLLFKIIYESIVQAFGQLTANKLRSFLSLLGITIGIFCIIGVQSAVDSMEENIRGSLKKLGDDVVYIQKFPWNEDPSTNFWKYMRRPNPSFDDFNRIKKNVESARLVDYHTFIGNRTIKFNSSSVEGAFVLAVGFDHAELFNINFEKGRYFNQAEFNLGLNKIVIGHKVAELLFGPIDPIGKTVKLLGQKMEIIGVIEKSGQDMIKIMDYDSAILISYPTGRKVANLRDDNPWGGTIAVKAVDNVPLEEMKGEVTQSLRASRKLRPKEKDNFALNQLSIISNALNSIFTVFDLLGLVIGIFAILVGGFGVANIMFVSVKERTNIIGIKKALGAKQWVIMLEFLIESVILCMVGGGFGLLMIFGVTFALKGVMPFEIYLSTTNIINGMLWSVAIGLVAGMLPAYQAAKMDPVEAIRS
jgi:putative ABC transport system permease protein